MEVKFYKAESGNYDLERGRRHGIGICADGLKSLTYIGRKLPDVLYAVFRKDETDNTFEIVPNDDSKCFSVKSRPGELFNGEIVLFSDFSERCAEAYRKGYRYFEFQVNA